MKTRLPDVYYQTNSKGSLSNVKLTLIFEVSRRVLPDVAVDIVIRKIHDIVLVKHTYQDLCIFSLVPNPPQKDFVYLGRVEKCSI